MAVGEVGMQLNKEQEQPRIVNEERFDFSKLKQGYLLNFEEESDNDFEEESDAPPAAEECVDPESDLMSLEKLKQTQDLVRLKQRLELPRDWSPRDWDLIKGVRWKGTFLNRKTEPQMIRRVLAASQNGDGEYRDTLATYEFMSAVEVFRWTKNVLAAYGLEGFCLILLGCNGYCWNVCHKDRDGPETLPIIEITSVQEALAAG